MGKTLGYARISTNEGQDATSQKAVLETLGAVVVFTEIGNGSSLDGRDQLEAAIRLLDPGARCWLFIRIAWRETVRSSHYWQAAIEKKCSAADHRPGNFVLMALT